MVLPIASLLGLIVTPTEHIAIVLMDPRGLRWEVICLEAIRLVGL